MRSHFKPKGIRRPQLKTDTVELQRAAIRRRKSLKPIRDADRRGRRLTGFDDSGIVNVLKRLSTVTIPATRPSARESPIVSLAVMRRRCRRPDEFARIHAAPMSSKRLSLDKRSRRGCGDVKFRSSPGRGGGIGAFGPSVALDERNTASASLRARDVTMGFAVRLGSHWFDLILASLHPCKSFREPFVLDDCRVRHALLFIEPIPLSRAERLVVRFELLPANGQSWRDVDAASDGQEKRNGCADFRVAAARPLAGELSAILQEDFASFSRLASTNAIVVVMECVHAYDLTGFLRE
jgi:hypothetical protein